MTKGIFPRRSCAALAALAAVACGPDFDTYCEEAEACLGGNDADIEACVASAEGEGDVASEIGCGDEFDEFVDCYLDKADCIDQTTGMPCTDDTQCNQVPQLNSHCSGGFCVYKTFGVADEDACKAEGNAYDHCM